LEATSPPQNATTIPVISVPTTTAVPPQESVDESAQWKQKCSQLEKKVTELEQKVKEHSAVEMKLKDLDASKLSLEDQLKKYHTNHEIVLEILSHLCSCLIRRLQRCDRISNIISNNYWLVAAYM
jgi:hypothetical protein